MLCLKHLDAKRNSFLTRGPVFFWTHFSDLSCIQGCFTLASPAFPLRVGPGLVMPQYCKINCNFRDSMSKVLLQMRIYTYDLYNLSIFNCVDLFTSQDSCSGSRVLSRAFRSSVTCPCLSPVLLIVVARRSSPSCLACAVACLWGSFLVCTSFGFRQALLQGLAPHLLLPRLLLPGLGGLDLPPTF